MPNDEQSFDAFISKVQGFHKSIEEEFAITSAENADDVRKLIDKKIATALPDLTNQLIMIATMGDTDNAKLSAIKFAFNYYFKESESADDPFTKMLNELTKNDKEKESNAS